MKWASGEGSIAWILCSADLSRGPLSIRVSQVMLVVKNPPANAGYVRDAVSIPGSERFSGGGHGNLLHYSCLENPTDRGVWQATLHRVAESDMTEVTYHEHMQGRDWGTMEKTQSSARKTIVL